jgi:anti-sigma factor RsiW
MSTDKPLRCADAEPYLSALADGEIAEPLRSAIAAHAATCPSCGETVERHRIVSRMMAALSDSIPSPAVLDRVLAARAPSSVESVRRESLRSKKRILIPRKLPAFLITPQAGSPSVPLLPRKRSWWQTAALPTLAAVLLVSLAFLAFHRLPAGILGSLSTQTVTPSPRGDPYLQAQAGVEAAVQAQPLSFSPEVPWSLPPSAVFQSATVNTATHALDIVWTLANPLAQLHVREAPVSLVHWTDYLLLGGSLPLAWQLPNKSAWSAASFTQDPARLAITQGDGALSIGVDVAIQGDGDVSQAGASIQTEAKNVLRLASLSMDSTRRHAPALSAPDTQTGILHYQAQSGSGANRTLVEAYVDTAHNRAHIAITDAQGKPLYDDFIQGTTDTRYDPQHHVYGRLPTLSTPLGEAPLDASAAAFFTLANSYVADGELWYLGQISWRGHSVVAQFVLTTASYLTYVYADAASGHILGAEVQYKVAQNIGATGVSSPLSPANGCMSYSLIAYLASAPPNTFIPPSGYGAGEPTSAATCAS